MAKMHDGVCFSRFWNQGKAELDQVGMAPQSASAVFGIKAKQSANATNGFDESASAVFGIKAKQIMP